MFLLCPVSMGVMMWVMMRGQNQSPQAAPPPVDPRLAELESQVNGLRSALRARAEQQPESQKADG